MSTRDPIEPAPETTPLRAMCHQAVVRIIAGETRYDEELDRLCDEFAAPRETVRPMVDEMLANARHRPTSTQ